MPSAFLVGWSIDCLVFVVISLLYPLLKRMRKDEQGQSQEVVTVSPRSVVVSPPLSRGKRKSSEEGEWSPATPITAPQLSPHLQLDAVDLFNGDDIGSSLIISDMAIPG